MALVGQEVTLVDASPDLELQLEREAIRQVDSVFITHWHYDHIGGLAALGEPFSTATWPLIDLYLPRQVVHHLDEELAYLKDRFRLHLTQPGDRWELADAVWEVVKTTQVDHSIGFAVEASTRLAYLVDSTTPPSATLARLRNLDLVILEATMDELDEDWETFSLEQAVECWKLNGADGCILTHLSCHSWKNHRLTAGLSHEERLEYEAMVPGPRFAFDGMSVAVWRNRPPTYDCRVLIALVCDLVRGESAAVEGLTMG